MPDDVSVQTIMQQMMNISSDVREIRTVQQLAATDNKNNSIKLERVLTQMEALNKIHEDFGALRNVSDDLDSRLKLVEREQSDCEKRRKEQQHEQRIKKLETQAGKLAAWVSIGCVLGVAAIEIFKWIFA